MQERVKKLIFVLMCLMSILLFSATAFQEELIAPVLENNTAANDDDFDLVQPMLTVSSVAPVTRSTVSSYTIYVDTINTNGDQVDGATVALIDSSDSIVATEESSTSTSIAFWNVSPGNYTLRFVATPSGYVMPDDIAVTVTEEDVHTSVTLFQGVELPSTGSTMMPLIYLAGLVILIISCIPHRAICKKD